MRREVYLQNQRQKRHKVTDENRELCDEFVKLISTGDELMEYETPGESKEKQWKFELMDSEWFTEIPEDLHENWLVKFGPEGFRVLVVSRNNHTTCYNKKGRVILKMRSHFPGGGYSEGCGITVLDCIYNNVLKTIFVLDCLFWNSMSMLESEASFRFYWLKSKFDEEPKLKKNQRYTFILMDCFAAQKPLIQDAIFTPFQVENHQLFYDGVVFYHKESHYTFGSTPLVAWLASYMLPEILQIDVPEEYMARKPKGYVCQKNFLEQLKTRKRMGNRKKPGENELEMES
ncbi:Snurportin-1 [Gonioctena quinquepunctata]|nr:Snurportin-1 [Gonioctena quinquepunctata]